MKQRARIRAIEDFNYWPSFVDVMTIISLVFFFLMIVSVVLTYAKYDESQKNNVEYERLKTEVERLNKKLKENEKNIDNIAEQRKDLYEDIVDKLKITLNDNVVFNEGRIDINSDVIFAINSSDLSSGGQILASQVADAFYNLLSDENYNQKVESIEIRGHTDNVGGGEYNRKLSTERAVSFLNCMLQDGSKYEAFATKFKASGMSKYEPSSGSVQSQSKEDMDKNRRIEIHIKFVDDDIAKAIKKLQNQAKE